LTSTLTVASREVFGSEDHILSKSRDSVETAYRRSGIYLYRFVTNEFKVTGAKFYNN